MAHTASSNQLGQISLLWASMPHQTSLYNSHFDCSILIEVGKILQHTQMCPKIMTISQLQVQKSNRMKYDGQTKMVS